MLLNALSLCFLASTINYTLARYLKVHDESFLPHYSLHVSYQEAAIACRYRWTALVNGTSPGPQIALRENQTTWIRVYNDMGQSNLTMHWHGLSQSVAPFSDGTPQASQWPIPPGHFFDYEIRPQIGEAGTYFYHSHVEFQAVSVAGPLIVEEADGGCPYQYDEEKLFFVSELFNRTDDQVLAGLSAPEASFAWSGEAEVILVNGKGYEGLNANESQAPQPWSQPPNTTSPTCSPEIFEVAPDTTYRFRVVGGSALSLVTFAFEDHDVLSIVAADGSYTKPATTDHVQVGSGQRFEFLLTTKSSEEIHRLGKTTFWIQLESRERPINITSYAVLSYRTQHSSLTKTPPLAPTKKPLKITDEVQDWLEYTLEPMTPNGFPPASRVSRTVYLHSEQIAAESGIFWSVNNHTWTEANEHLDATPFNDTASNTGVPYLVDIYRRGEEAIPDFDNAVANDGRSADYNVYVGKVGEIIDVVLINEPNGVSGGFDVHPWHIHGKDVYDLGSGPGKYDAAANEKRLKGYNPVLRDSTYLYKYTTTDGIGTLAPYSQQGWRAWRLMVQDAGVWMVHCHTLPHMLMGMQTVWVMGDAAQITEHLEPFVRGYLNYGGSAYGNSTYDPLVLHYFDE